MTKGYVQVYTGNGKGKTTAALGLALRSICAGKTVYMGQFIKGMAYSELKAPELLPGFEIHQFGRDCFIEKDPAPEDIKCAREGFKQLQEALNSGKYNLVIADELNIATLYKLISVEEVVDLIENKPEQVELIITGRYAHEKIIEKADLVTEMKEIKHYYRIGVEAREGIEF